MKIMILYPYEYEHSALTIQAKLLEKGLKELSKEVVCVCATHKFATDVELASFNPDVVIGVGFWGDFPKLIREPLKKGFKTIPWFNANGWVANYHDELNKLPLLLVTSDWVKKTYIRDGVNGKNIRPLHIGLDTSVFRPLSKTHPGVSKVREMLGLKDELVFLTIGGDVTSKGAQEMFHALAKIKDQLPNWKYVCKSWPSDTTTEWRVKELALIRSLGISDHIVFHDEIIPNSHMQYLFNACDIYAAPSRLEGFGMLQVEAMACAKPVISINAMGPSSTIVHGKTGFLADVANEVKLSKEWVYPSMGFDIQMQIEFPVSKTFEYHANTDQLADFALTLATDPELRKTMGQSAAKHVFENFHYKKIAQDMLNLIRETSL